MTTTKQPVTTEIDLDAIERTARELLDEGHAWRPEVVLALVARIRELEAAASGNDCRAPGLDLCDCCISRGGYR